MSGRWDAVVVGAGPAGLSAALWLARYRRRTLVLDDQRPRNEAARAVHGFPGLPDIQPESLRQRLVEQATRAGAMLKRCRVIDITGTRDDFTVHHSDGDTSHARRLLFAYGRTDRIPDIQGIEPLLGRSAFHCPDCDGPSVVDLRIGVLGYDRPAAELALFLLTWTPDIRLLTHGQEPAIDDHVLHLLQAHHITVHTATILSLEGSSGRLERVRTADETFALDAVFFHWGSHPSANLARNLGCESRSSGDLVVHPATLRTSVPGIYAAGDIAGRPYLAIIAAAEGVRAALAIHRSLLPPEFKL